MIRDAIEYLVSLGETKLFDVGERKYAERQLVQIEEPLPEPIILTTLSGIVDYVNAQRESGGDLCGEKFFVHVENFYEVHLVSNLIAKDQNRKVFVSASPPPYDGFKFGHFMDLESFITQLQCKFVQDEATSSILQVISALNDESVWANNDNGITQVVSRRNGITLSTQAIALNPVFLRPYRTFAEIEQPASPFVLRIRRGKDEPAAALFEADGGRWKFEAVKSIRAFFRLNLPSVPVVA